MIIEAGERIWYLSPAQSWELVGILVVFSLVLSLTIYFFINRRRI